MSPTQANKQESAEQEDPSTDLKKEVEDFKSEFQKTRVEFLKFAGKSS